MQNPYESPELGQPEPPGTPGVLRYVLIGITVVLLSGPVFGIAIGIADWFNGEQLAIRDDPDGSSNWTPYSPRLQRKLYKGKRAKSSES